MTITLIDKRLITRRFVTWDLEWVPHTYKLRMCGVFDPWVGYRCYRSMKEFIGNELLPSNSGIWYFAHYGGKADLQFLIEEIADRNEFSAKGQMVGSACVRCTIRHGRYHWHFLDSFWLLHARLKDIAKWIGEEKTGPTEDMTEEQREKWYESVDDKTLREYNENDCVVLWRAIEQAQLTILEMGSQLQATLASTAMGLFRRRYLTEAIHTNKAINAIAREAYEASRVEVFRTSISRPGKFFDINSSFPYAMTKPMPASLIRNYYQRIPDRVWDDYPFIAYCRVSVPEMYLPPIPMRLANRIFFPVGEWEGWFTGVDLKLLVERGGHFSKVSHCKVFEPFYDLKEYAEEVFEKRKNSQGFEREFYKLLLNSLYGKFAEQSEKRGFIINPSAYQLEKLNREMDMWFPGVFFPPPVVVPIPHAHVPISAYTVAYARGTLDEYMEAASEVFYCDTDGFACDDEFATGPGLGELKVEKIFQSARFIVPKLYDWLPAGESIRRVKAKGFSFSKDPATAAKQFEHLIGGGEIRIVRMARIKENLAGGSTRPTDKIVKKRLSMHRLDRYTIEGISKRLIYPDGYSRPWHVKELLDGK